MPYIWEFSFTFFSRNFLLIYSKIKSLLKNKTRQRLRFWETKLSSKQNLLSNNLALHLLIKVVFKKLIIYMQSFIFWLCQFTHITDIEDELRKVRRKYFLTWQIVFWCLTPCQHSLHSWGSAGLLNFNNLNAKSIQG